MDWLKVTQDNDKVSIPTSWIFIHYYEALNILFRLENVFRMFVYITLKNELLEKWVDVNVTSDDSNEGSIKSIARKRINQAKQFGYLGYNVNCPIMHLTSGELFRIITSDAYWKYFNTFFYGKKDIIANKLDEISAVRNAFAHFRPIKNDDIDTVKQNAKHLFTVLESNVVNIIKISNVVPTNTTDEWYQQLKGIECNENCALTFYQSKKEDWIRVNIKFNCPIIYQDTNKRYSWVDYKVININSANILKEFPELTRLIIYLSEQIYSPSMDNERHTKFIKDINMIFSRKILNSNYQQIKTQIEDFLNLIKNEIELIKSDNLAKGKLLDLVNSYAYIKESSGSKYWTFTIDELRCSVAFDDPPEFWGDYNISTNEFVVETHRFPWMPVDISEEGLPF